MTNATLLIVTHNTNVDGIESLPCGPNFAGRNLRYTEYKASSTVRLGLTMLGIMVVRKLGYGIQLSPFEEASNDLS